MGYCKKYRKKIKDGMCFCSVCEIGQNEGKRGTETPEPYDDADIADNRAMAALSYLGPLVLVPVLAAKESGFVRFHANQGLTLLTASAAYGIVSSILTSAILAVSWRLSYVGGIIRFGGLAFPVFAIMGIINAAGGHAKELPVIGKMRLFK